jgi:hypothetical protein
VDRVPQSLTTEASIEGRCRDIAALNDALLIKLQHGTVGMPDRLLLRPNKPPVFIEFKRPGEPLKPIQKHWRDILGGMGYRAIIVRSTSEFWGLLTG